MAEQPRDLNLSENFHRTKRTALLFCAAFTVLGLATVKESMTARVVGLDIELAVSTLRWLIWISATYYVFGFALEAQNARRMNLEIMAGSGAKGIDATLEALIKSYQARSGEIAQRLKSLEQMDEAGVTRKLKEEVAKLDIPPKNIRNAVHRRMRGINIDPRLPRETLINSVFNAIMEELKEYMAKAAQRRVRQHGSSVQPFFQVEKSLKDAERSAAFLASETTKLRNDMRRLMSGLGLARKAWFWWWEIGGTLGAYLIATIIGWPALQDVSSNVLQQAWNFGRSFLAAAITAGT